MGILYFHAQFTGHGLGDFMTGQVRLTVSMSVRWDPSLPQYLKHGGIANFDYARFNTGTTTQQDKFGPSGCAPQKACGLVPRGRRAAVPSTENIGVAGRRWTRGGQAVVAPQIASRY